MRWEEATKEDKLAIIDIAINYLKDKTTYYMCLALDYAVEDYTGEVSPLLHNPIAKNLCKLLHERVKHGYTSLYGSKNRGSAWSYAVIAGETIDIHSYGSNWVGKIMILDHFKTLIDDLKGYCTEGYRYDGG